MDMFGHNHRRMQLHLLTIIVQAMPKNSVAGWFGERVFAQFSKGYEKRPVVFLIMRKPSPILVFLHSCASVVCSCGADTLVRGF